ncbi:hypothetical protein [Treponema sp. R80B11-R83G3]
MTKDKQSIVIKNIYYMLSYAYQNLQHNNYKEIETEYFENIQDIDAKYYGKIMQTQYDSDTFQSNNLYQIFAYVKNEDKNNTGLVSGMLLYAKTDEDIFPTMIYDLGGNRIGVKALDLGRDFSNIKKQLNAIINEWSLA